MKLSYGDVKGMVSWLVNEVMSWALLAAGFAFALLLTGTVLAKAGFPLRFAPPVSEIWLAYIAGAFWLWRGR